MLHFRRSGPASSPAPPIVLLHGLFGSLENLGVLGRKLSEHHMVYALDLPNHGRSEHTQQADLQTMAAQVWQFICEHTDQKVVLIGHSLGGKIAMEIALRHAVISGLIVMDIAPVSYPRRHDEVFAGLKSLPLADKLSRSELNTRLGRYVDEAAVRSFLLKNLLKQGDYYTWRMNLTDLEQSYVHLVCENYKSVYQGPTMFVKGELSNYINETQREAIESRFPKAELKVISGTNHWLHAEKPDQTARTIVRFLKSYEL